MDELVSPTCQNRMDWAKYGIWGGVVKCTSLVTRIKYVANLFKKETEFTTLVESAIKIMMLSLDFKQRGPESLGCAGLASLSFLLGASPIPKMRWVQVRDFGSALLLFGLVR